VPILDPAFRAQLRAKSKSRDHESKGATDRDSFGCGAITPPRENDTNAALPPGDDPDANIDPDDRGVTVDSSDTFVMRQNSGNLFRALPAMPCSWWVHVTLDPPDTPVIEDARLCVSLVSAHLRQASQEALSARLMSRQGRGQRNGRLERRSA
jgi:hypothetical protein